MRNVSDAALFCVFLGLVSYTQLLAQKPGTFDPSFSGDGIATATFPDVSIDTPGNGRAVVVQPDGKIIAVGYSSINFGQTHGWSLMRCLANGQMDFSFGTKGRVLWVPGGKNPYDNQATAVSLQADGKIVVLGSVSTGSGRRPAMARFLADGQLDLSFGDLGKVIFTSLGPLANSHRLEMQPDGRILITLFNGATPKAPMTILRCNPNGSLDTTFDTDGKVTVEMALVQSTGIYEPPVALALQPDGKILVGGTTIYENGYKVDFALVRLHRNGSPDLSFGGTGWLVISLGDGTNHAGDILNDLAVLHNGDILAIGTTNQQCSMVRLNPDGSLDGDFGSGGKVFSTGSPSEIDQIKNMAVQVDGRILALSKLRLANGNYQARMLRFLANGAPDTSYSGNGVVEIPVPVLPSGSDDLGPASVSSMALQADGKAVLVAETNTLRDFALARLTTAGAMDSSFDGDGRSNVDLQADIFNLSSLEAICQQVDGKILAASAPGRNVAVCRFHPDGSLDTAFGQEGLTLAPVNNASYSAKVAAITVQADGKILVAGTTYMKDINGGDLLVMRFLANGAVDTSFNGTGKVLISFSTYEDGATDMKLQTDGKIVLSGYWELNSINKREMACWRLNTDGSPDTSFNGIGAVYTAIDTSSEANALVIQPDGKILIAGSATKVTSSKETTGVAMCRYHPNGTLDTTFGTSGKKVTPIGEVRARARDIALLSDGSIVACGATLGSTYYEDTFVARFQPGGSLDTNFGVDGIVLQKMSGDDDEGVKVVAQADDKIFLMGYAYLSTTTVTLMRYLPTGALDTGFGSGGKSLHAGSNPRDLALQSDGQILVAGSKYNTSGNLNFAVMRFIGQPAPEIAVEQPAGAGLTDGVSTLAWGQVTQGVTVPLTVTVKNIGSMPLTGLALSVTGTHAADFVPGGFTATPLAPGTSRVFTVAFTPGDLGARSAALGLTSNDATEASFDISLTGTGVAAAAPVITPPPVSRLVMTGLPVTLEALGTFGRPSTLTWLKNNAVMKGVTGSSLAMPAVSLKEAGTYRLRVSNAHSSVDSADILLGVMMPAPPVLAVKEGAIITLTCTAAGPDLEYEWLCEGEPVQDAVGVSGNKDKVLKIINATPALNGTYTCRITLPAPGGNVYATHGDTEVTVFPKPTVTPPVLSAKHVSQFVSIPVIATDRPTRYAAKGLPPGITIHPTSGLISGRATAARLVKGELSDYSVVITVTNMTGSTSTPAIPWTIHPLPAGLAGTYQALIGRGATNTNRGGVINLTITNSGQATLSWVWGKDKYSAKTAVEPPAPSESGPARVTVQDYAGENIVDVSIAADTRDVTGTFEDIFTFTGWRCPYSSGNKTGYKGVVNTAISFSGDSATGTGSVTRPRGDGYALVTIADTGIAKWACTLADGTTFTASSLIGTGNRTLVFASLYERSTNGFMGTTTLTPDASGLLLSGSGDWFKSSQPSSSKTRTYKGGFGALPLTISLRGREYRKPAAGAVVLGLGQPPNNAELVLVEGGLSPTTPLIFSLDSVGKSKVESGTANPLGINKLAVNPVTGLITGSMLLVSNSPPVTRAPKLAGLLVLHPDVNAGIGHFNLPELPGVGGDKDATPIQSGRLLLTAP